MKVTRKFTKAWSYPVHQAINEVNAATLGFMHAVLDMKEELMRLGGSDRDLPADYHTNSEFIAKVRAYRALRDGAMARLGEGPYSHLSQTLDAVSMIPLQEPSAATAVTGHVRLWANKGLDFWGPVNFRDPDAPVPGDTELAAWIRNREDVMYILRDWAKEQGRHRVEEETFWPARVIAEYYRLSIEFVSKRLEPRSGDSPGSRTP